MIIHAWYSETSKAARAIRGSRYARVVLLEGLGNEKKKNKIKKSVGLEENRGISVYTTPGASGTTF